MGRITRAAGIGAASFGLLLGSTGVAQADEQSYLDYLFSHGFSYHFGVSSAGTAVKGGQLICDNVRWNGGPRNGVNPVMAATLDDVMIAGARAELCPDAPWT